MAGEFTEETKILSEKEDLWYWTGTVCKTPGAVKRPRENY